MSAPNINTATHNPEPPFKSIMSWISSLEDNVHVLQSGGGNIHSDKILSIHHLTTKCLFSINFSCSRPGYFHSKGCLIRHPVSLYDMANVMLAEADRRANAANRGITVNHTNKCVVYITAYLCCWHSFIGRIICTGVQRSSMMDTLYLWGPCHAAQGCSPTGTYSGSKKCPNVCMFFTKVDNP